MTSIAYRLGLFTAAALSTLAGAPVGAADSWRSQSLRDQPATGPTGTVTTAEAMTFNRRMGAERKAVT